MATTPEYGIRYPSGGDDVDIATSLQNLALDVEGAMNDNLLPATGGTLTGPITVPYGNTGGIHIGGSGPQVLSGTKSPYHTDNVLVLENLAVGSLWIQTDYAWKSVGIVSNEYSSVVWVKKWPTSSYQNQWAVLYGDTGPRNVMDGGMLAYNVNGGSYLDTGTPFTDFQIRRINNTIYATMTGINFTSTQAGWTDTVIIEDADAGNADSPGYSWGPSGDTIFGTAFQESSSTMKPFRVYKSGNIFSFQVYAPSGTALYSATISYPARPYRWPRVESNRKLGYLGVEDTNNADW
jgi:hypothetical protein